MKTLLLPTLLLTVAVLAFPVRAQEKKPGPPAWFEAKPDRTFVMEIVLKAGESKPVKIAAKKSTVVGFQTNFTAEQAKEFEQNPIVLGNDIVFAGSSSGAWTMFEPQDGTIALKLENTSTAEVRVAVYTKEKM